MNKSKLHNILLIVLLGVCLILWSRTNSEKNHLKSMSNLYMEKYKTNSLNIIAKKEKEIKYLHKQIIEKQQKIDKSFQAIDSLKKLKARVDVIYINKVKEIKDFNSIQLENYFNEELN